MRVITGLVAAAIVAQSAPAAAVPVPAPVTQVAAIPFEPAGEYIVTLRGTADAPAVAAEHARISGVVVGHVYQHALRGYSARLTPAAAAQIARDPRVHSVQPDALVRIAAHQPQ